MAIPKEIDEELLRYLPEIPRREQDAIRMRFGLDGEKPMTYKEMGERIERSSTRARDLVKNGIRRMRNRKFRKEREEEDRKKYLEAKMGGMALDLDTLRKAIVVLDQYELYDSTKELKKALELEILQRGKEDNDVSLLPICILDTTVRTYNCLKNAGIETLHDLARLPKEKLERVRNYGKKSLKETCELLSRWGLVSGMTDEEITRNLTFDKQIYDEVVQNYKLNHRYMGWADREKIENIIKTMGHMLNKQEITE